MNYDILIQVYVHVYLVDRIIQAVQFNKTGNIWKVDFITDILNSF